MRKKIESQQKQLEYYENQTAITIKDNLIEQIKKKSNATTNSATNMAAASVITMFAATLQNTKNVGELFIGLLEAAFALAATDPTCKKIIEEKVNKWPNIQVENGPNTRTVIRTN